MEVATVAGGEEAPTAVRSELGMRHLGGAKAAAAGERGNGAQGSELGAKRFRERKLGPGLVVGMRFWWWQRPLGQWGSHKPWGNRWG